jgi:hypothetical protein
LVEGIEFSGASVPDQNGAGIICNVLIKCT